MSIDGLSLDVLGPLGSLLVVVFLPYIQMARGKLVPRTAIEDERADTKTWQAAHADSEQARRELIAQNRELLEHAQAVEAFMKALAEIRGKS